jgi:hypothetical protein
MNTTRREELAALAIAGELTATERAELDIALRADAAFAREVEALHETDAALTALARPLVQHPQLVLGGGALENIRRAAAARARRPWWALPKMWLGTGLAAAACAALALVIFSSRAGPAARGATLLSQTAAKYPTANARLGVMAPATPTAKACLWLPAAEWSALSADDRAALIAYVKAQVPAIRRDPARYAGVPATDPNFAAITANLARLRDGEFMIVTLVQDRSSGLWARVPGPPVAEG